MRTVARSYFDNGDLAMRSKLTFYSHFYRRFIDRALVRCELKPNAIESDDRSDPRFLRFPHAYLP